MRRSVFKLGQLVAVLLSVTSALLSNATAQTAPPAPDEAAFATWADRVYGGAVEVGRIDAAVVGVVVDGQPLFARGYGFSDTAHTVPVSPDTTTFRLASISKTFAAVLVAQLEAEGALPNLDSPLVESLPGHTLTGADAGALSFRQVLTHRSGLEEQLFSFAATSAEQVRGPAPRFYRAPGERTNYSNTAFGLLGPAVESASGAAYGDQIQARIFDALGMRHARYRTAVGADASLANASYVAPDGTRWPMPNDWMLRPDRAASGGVEASASDMQAYMIALLDQGRSDQRLGLDVDSFAPLFAEQARAHPAANAFGMSFFLADWNGTRVVEHGGVFPGHRAYMHLIPERGIGIFVATTGEAATPPLSALIGRWPHAPAPGAAPVRPMTLSEMRAENLTFILGAPRPPERQDVSGSAGALAGRYAPERRNRSSIEHALDLVRAEGMVRTIRALSPTRIQVDGHWSYDEIAPGVFWRQAAGAADSLGFYDTLIALPAANGQPDAFTYTYNDVDYERIGPSDDIVLQRNLLLFAVIAGLTGALFWIGGGAVRGAALAPLAMSLCIIAMFATLMLGFAANDSIISQWSLGKMSRAIILAGFGNAAALAALLTIGSGVRAIARGPGALGLVTIWRYAHHLGLIAVAATVLWALYHLRLLGWWAP